MPTTRHMLAPLAAAAAATLLAGCGGGPPELSEAMAAVCDEDTTYEPEPSPFDDTDPSDPEPLEELRCERSALTLSGNVYDEDPSSYLQGLSDSVESGDGGDYWTAVAEGDGRWVVVGFSAAPSDEDPEFLDPLKEMGFEVDK
ncbi:hypothetical protein [Nocardioides sp. CFH 31398]|uniref:hypothetical protein n=1 Tax=Nocardioides sp. CFH 31398 TaxID=2919579 RepID=UPI001F067197|nr:hypothetical protein [Nocardioides sp. CFH 31398]MCH1867514.1 hypothetical protein [Nocardioides sp. CFH 31398]